MIRLKSILLESKLVFKFNDRGREIKAIQQKLMALGYSVGHKQDDGWFGRLTKRAVEKFQKQNDLRPTGELDQVTVDLINSGYGKPEIKTVTTTDQSVNEPEIAIAKSLTVTSPYGIRKRLGGRMHKGTDYAAKTGTNIQLLIPGQVMIADMDRDPRGWGALVQIKHEDGTITRYAHLSSISVQAGDSVNAGDIIGQTGGNPGDPGAGRSTGAHLHWEYIPAGSSKQSDGEDLANLYFTLK